MKRILKFLSLTVIAASLALACKKDGPDPVPGPDPSEKFIITGVTIPESIVVVAEEDYSFTFNGRGPAVGDEMVFTSKTVSGKVIVIPVKAVTPSSFTINVPLELDDDVYTIKIRRGEKAFTVSSETTVSVTVKIDVNPASGSTIYGVVLCGKRPVADAVISDGYEVVKTDAKGVYQMASQKKNGYVFISVPSGYRVAMNSVVPQIWKNTAKPETEVERIDFALYDDGDQTNHTMLFFGDMHLANRTSDRSQFRVFTDEIRAYMNSHKNEKIYAMTLGDMTWDLYWYDNKYSFNEYLAEVKPLEGLPIFHSIGNHDHDMKASGDWTTQLPFRAALGPNYYSFNIGGIHYVSLDDIECTNTSGGTSSDRHYNEKIISDDLNWLARDLQFVDPATPVVVTMHAPMYNQSGSAALTNTATVETYFSGRKVTFVTGHSHKNWYSKKNNIEEYNSGAVCASWWWCGHYTSGLNIAQDGAPGGYRIMSVKGTSYDSFYKGIGRPDDYQFRTYDRNSIKIDPAEGGSQSAAYETALAKYGSYNIASSANYVLINVWDYNPSWKIEVSEVETGKTLTVTRQTVYDPLYLPAYCGKRFNAGATSLTFTPFSTNHMFRVTASSATSTLIIKVTDDEGRTYTETMKRPKTFSLQAYK